MRIFKESFRICLWSVEVAFSDLCSSYINLADKASGKWLAPRVKYVVPTVGQRKPDRYVQIISIRVVDSMDTGLYHQLARAPSVVDFSWRAEIVESSDHSLRESLSGEEGKSIFRTATECLRGTVQQ